MRARVKKGDTVTNNEKITRIDGETFPPGQTWKVLHRDVGGYCCIVKSNPTRTVGDVPEWKLDKVQK